MKINENFQFRTKTPAHGSQVVMQENAVPEPLLSILLVVTLPNLEIIHTWRYLVMILVVMELFMDVVDP